MHAVAAGMPPLGSELLDPDGIAIVDAWILSLGEPVSPGQIGK